MAALIAFAKLSSVAEAYGVGLSVAKRHHLQLTDTGSEGPL